MLAEPLPDLDAAMVTFLREHDRLAPLHGGRVSTHIVDTADTRLQVTSIGGTQPTPWEGYGEYQLDAWGGTEDEAYMLASTVCAAIYDMRGPITGGYVIVARPTLRPVASPDPETGRPRYLTQVQIRVVPAQQ